MLKIDRMLALSGLVEQTTTKDGSKRALELISICVRKFKRSKLSGGNCGTFALALGRQLREEGYQPTLGFIYRCDNFNGRKPCDTIQEVISLETDIYHVFLVIDGQFFDATGITTVDAIFSIAEQQYDDDDAGDFSDVAIDDPAMINLIDNDTDWSISASVFETAMAGNGNQSF